ncbi:ricin-type beta-trefoil lectin domain protein [Faucicola boevrei]|uniref:ricin-type beta-trefoil lectin domain protein n=1 Tax=Faucicola boevrei TaxID=346665 RepID=UPI00037566BF|nr:ricin-type beta-trefoil lectin domain protein [Moraxella boevrei]
MIAHRCHGKANQLFVGKDDQTIRQNEKCLDVAGESQTNGTPVILHQCHGKLNQKWYSDGKQLRNQLTGKCLTVNQHNRVVIATCQNQVNQRFDF